MTHFANLGLVPAHLRAQVEAKLRSGATIHTHDQDKGDSVSIPKPNKFGARKTVLDGITFASEKEALRWRDLRLMEAAGEIINLRRQITYQFTINGVEICTYRADFVYRSNGQTVVEDAKGYRKGTAYRLFLVKSALMRALHHTEVKVV